MKVKNQYLKILEYLHLSFNKWPSIQYKLWVSLVIWNQSDDLGCHVICWCWSAVFSEPHSQCSNLPEHFRALHALFCWQALWRCWFHFPAGLGTCPHCQRYQKLVQWPCVTVFDWPANSPDLNLIENLDERHQTQQCRWPEPHRESRWETPDSTMQMTWTSQRI